MAQSKMLDPGELNQRVDIMAETSGVDEMGGGLDPSSSPLFTVWAAFRKPTSKQIAAAQALQDEITWIVTVRYRDTILSTHWLRHRGKRYDIVGEPVNIDMANQFLEIPVKHTPSRDPV
jgi:SPP1 family predicted phage head-tail adaptor